ncbi:MAG: class I SAM-dependent methyltransferase [Patescibacteria group bacterium]|nr:class I SAM-dependent methyltransferase [Patescibacteria group bacterium]
MDITKELPFQNEVFDGVFCAGTLHLFTFNILRRIFSEINRVLRPGGLLIFDFAVDIKRQYIKPTAKKEKSLYSYRKAKSIILKNLKGYRINTSKSRFFDDLSGTPGYYRITT